MNTKKVYSPYGYHSPSPGVLGFNGERPALITGYYHLGNGHRSYSTVLMRFLSADSLSPFAQGGLNAYAYCLGDPVNNQDPSGRNIWNKLLRIAEPVVKEATFSGVIGYHATERWNTSSILTGLKRGHSLEGQRSLGEAVYFGKSRAYVEPYRAKAIEGVVFAGMLQDGVSLVPGIGYKKDVNGVTAIHPPAYGVIKMVEKVPPGAVPIDLPPTGIFAKTKTTSIRSESQGAEAPSVEAVKIRGKQTWQ
ncbi:RHS repeat-associated core domain-containing protein [Pseudomonas sp. S13.1.2]|uniref:RHS repeat-associated core domain-containing protein n=1 Tax=Pseudomonas TaxID=286 RepID=UPI0009BA3ED2